jgi:hypothetical protein
MSPRWSSTPGLTDWLTVSHNMTLTFIFIVDTIFQGVERSAILHTGLNFLYVLRIESLRIWLFICTTSIAYCLSY